MKNRIKASIDELKLPCEEKEEIFCRLTDWKSRKKYKDLQRRFVLAIAVLSISLIASNWNKLITEAQNFLMRVELYAWKGEAIDSADNSMEPIGGTYMEVKQYQIPGGMEERPCETTRVRVSTVNNPTKVETETHVGNYHYLMKKYDTLKEAADELGVSLLLPFEGKLDEINTELIICQDVAEEPAVLKADYIREGDKTEFCSCRATMYGGSLPARINDGGFELGESFDSKYQAESGIEAYIFYNRYTRTDSEVFCMFNNVYEGENAHPAGVWMEWEEWESQPQLFVQNKSYEALFFHDGIKYEIAGISDLDDLKEILDGLEI